MKWLSGTPASHLGNADVTFGTQNDPANWQSLASADARSLLAVIAEQTLGLNMRIMDDLTRLRLQVLGAVAMHGADRVRVFGSVVRGEDSPSSDVDFLVTLRPGRTLLDLTRLELDLEALIGRRVDVVTEASLNDPVRESVLREAALV